MEFKAERKVDNFKDRYPGITPYQKKSKWYYLLVTLVGLIVLSGSLLYLNSLGFFKFIKPSNYTRWDDAERGILSPFLFALLGLIVTGSGLYQLIKK